MTFISQGIYAGAIYPLKFTPNLDVNTSEFRSLFTDEFEEKETILNLRKFVYEPDLQKVSSMVYKHQLSIKYCRFETDLVLKDINFSVYLLLYKEGYASFIYWVDLAKNELNYQEIVELGAMTKGTKARFHRLGITLEWNGTIKEVNGFYDICKLLEDRISSNSNQHILNTGGVNFAYPMLYLLRVPDCSDSVEIVTKYSRELKGITNLWVDFEKQMLKDKDIDNTILTDYHPFNYGVSLASSVCSIEVHATNIDEAMHHYDMDESQMHFEERFDWIFQGEVPIMHYFILRHFDSRLSKVPNKFPSLISILKKPLLVFSLINQLIVISNLYREITNSISEFRGIYLTKREYSTVASKLYFNIFNIEYINNEIDKKLVVLQNEINISYSILTTLFLFALTIIGTLFAFFQALASIKSLGWIE